ncbi:MAG: class I SAM-dependent methyltransferase [Xanthobacteraceae bacterium]
MTQIDGVGIVADVLLSNGRFQAMDNPAGFIGNIPQHYDQGLGPIIFADFAEDMAHRVAAYEPRRVLETAAGTGIVTRSLRDHLPAEARLVATDLNPPMLDVARRKFRSGEAVEFEPADAMALPFEAASFDVVVCQFGVMFYPDKDKAYREVYRVLAPGGRYLFSVWDSHKYNPFGRIAHELVGRAFPVDPPQFQKVPFSYPFDSIKASVIEAGFADINAAVLKREKILPDTESFARALVYGSPIIDQVQARGGVDAEQIVESLASEFRGEFGVDPGRMPLQAIFFSARKPS